MKKSFTFLLATLFFMQSSWVQATPTASGGSPLESFQNFFNSSSGIIIVSGIAASYSAILYKGAADQEEESKANVKKIDKMIATFKDSYAGYCPNGRDTLADPACYCYTDAGKQNTARNNSQTCVDLWAKGSYTLNGDAANYNLATYSADVAGCLTVDGQFDENCRCKKLVDSKGKNACKKESSITISNDAFSTGLATSAGLKDLLKYSANSTSGNANLNLLSAASLTSNAIKARAVTEQLLSKIEAADKKNAIPRIDESNVGRMAASVIGQKAIDTGMKNSGGAMNVASSRSANPKVENLLQQAQAKAGIDLTGSGGKGLANKKDGKKTGINLNFSDMGSSNSNGQVVQDFPEATKSYKYKNSDIVTDNSTSIFEIISNRYVQSGLKRLFDEDTK